MPEVFKRTVIVTPPKDAPADVVAHFDALASRDGFEVWFQGNDTVTGEQVLVRLAHGFPQIGEVPLQ